MVRITGTIRRLWRCEESIRRQSGKVRTGRPDPSGNFYAPVPARDLTFNVGDWYLLPAVAMQLDRYTDGTCSSFLHDKELRCVSLFAESSMHICAHAWGINVLIGSA